MPARLTPLMTSAALIVAGLCVATWTGFKLLDSKDLAVPLNPCGINRSPYGEVFAMAMQGPINTDFHVGMYGATPQELAQLQKQADKRAQPGSMLIVKPDPEEAEAAEKPVPRDVMGRMQYVIDEMRVGHNRRTNPLPASDKLKFYLRRQAENKLRFAYRLDPSHYANYNALHFFLTEGIGTRPELTPMAGKLAEDTIEYCLSIDHDPRPALTAAAACTNILHLMFASHNDGEDRYSPDQMDAVIAKLDECLATYHRIAAQWDENGNWERISEHRIHSYEHRLQFISRIRDAADKTVDRIRTTYAK